MKKFSYDKPKAAELEHRLAFLTNTPTTDDDGYAIENWQESFTVWGGARNPTTKEKAIDSTTYHERTKVFVVRYKSTITESMRIVYKGNQYSIDELDGETWQDEFMLIRASLVHSKVGGRA